MKEPLTDELLAELLKSDDPARFADEHKLVKRNLSDYLDQLLEEKGLVRSEVINASGVNYTYAYELFMGRKAHPSRDYVLQITLAMGCTLLETNRVLQAAGLNELYCKNRRDAIILYCIEQGGSLQEVDEALYRYREQTLSKSS